MTNFTHVGKHNLWGPWEKTRENWEDEEYERMCEELGFQINRSADEIPDELPKTSMAYKHRHALHVASKLNANGLPPRIYKTGPTRRRMTAHNRNRLGLIS